MIQSDDIKLLASAVMADVPEGGGAATGTEIVDGQSNNIFPDVSADDRAAGRVNLRKVFGQAHTDNDDELLGASFAVLSPPADPLVSVSMFQTDGWADERTTAQATIERYVVKGPRYACRILDTHYTGSLLLQLYQAGGRDFPSAGDAVALRNPSGSEQFVRIIRVTISSGSFNVGEGTGVVTFDANIAVCELAQPLSMDVLGPPIARVTNENNYAVIYSTTLAAGAQFVGVKALASAAEPGDRTVSVAGGIYTPLVPASTVEEPLTDIAPLLTRSALCRTAQAALTLPAQNLNMSPGNVLQLPTAAQPGSLTITRSGTVFSDDGNGVLLQGTSPVGAVDYRARTVTIAAGAPSYGTASTTISYTPATPSGATTHSAALDITSANAGLAFVAAFAPAPAPGTFTVSYMAQGRWYELVDNGSGKLAGADSSYGSGTVNYASGSIAYTLGAIPDVGSAIIYGWGNAATAVAVAANDLPSRVSGVFSVDQRHIPGTLVLSWARGGTDYEATVDVGGVVSGDATGLVVGGTVTMQPAVMPDGPVALAYSRAVVVNSSFTGSGLSVTLSATPVVPGSVTFGVDLVPLGGGYITPASITVIDNGAGVLYRASSNTVVGSINYSTGAVSVSSAINLDVIENVVVPYTTATGSTAYYTEQFRRNGTSVTVNPATVASVAYRTGSTVSDTATATPAWQLSIPLLTGRLLKSDALAFSFGGQVYTSQNNTLQTAWNSSTGTGTAAGTTTSSGAVTFSAQPTGTTNAVTWINASQDTTSPTVGSGVFRVASAPIKTGVFQIKSGTLVGTASEAGVITGNGWAGSVDYQRGIVKWSRTSVLSGSSIPWNTWTAAIPIQAASLTYNAVFLQYVPIDGSLLGLETARLPLDGKVPIFRAGGQVLIHNTLTTQLPNPLTKGTVYSMGRERIAALVLRTATGARVSGALFNVDFDAGTLVVPVESDLTGLAQPFTAHHRIEDEILVLKADLSGLLTLVSGLTHDYPAGTSFVSGKLRKGDLFARAFLYIEQATWTGVWSDALIGSEPTASYNSTDYPFVVTSRGAITERWAIIFLSSTTVRIVGESVGQIVNSVSINADISPLNPQTGAPYFTIPALGWGGGWSAGNVLRTNTAAAGAPAWIARTILPGSASVASDSAIIAFRADVDA